MGPDGKPMTGEGGGVLGPDGKVMIGPDGKPLQNPSWAPPADKVDSNGMKPNFSQIISLKLFIIFEIFVNY